MAFFSNFSITDLDLSQFSDHQKIDLIWAEREKNKLDISGHRSFDFSRARPSYLCVGPFYAMECSY